MDGALSFLFIVFLYLDGTDIHIHITRYAVYGALGGVLPDIVASAVAALVCVVRYPDAVAAELGYIQVRREPALACVYHRSVTGVGYSG